MALAYLAGELKGPVRKPTGHEPMATHVNKLLSGALNYHGMPVPVDSRPVLTGAAGAPKALITKPVGHDPAFRSNIPLPFHEVVYNANARHVPDIETLGGEAAKRKAEGKLKAIRASFIPAAGAIGALHQSNVTALESRLLEKRNQLLREGLTMADVERILAPDYQEIRKAKILAGEAASGINPVRARTESMLGMRMPQDTYQQRLSMYTDELGKTMGLPAAIELARAEVTKGGLPMTAEEEAAMIENDPDVRYLRRRAAETAGATLGRGDGSLVDVEEMAARSRDAMSSAPRDITMFLSSRHQMERALMSSTLVAPTASGIVVNAAAQPAANFGIGQAAGSLAAAAVPGARATVPAATGLAGAGAAMDEDVDWFGPGAAAATSAPPAAEPAAAAATPARAEPAPPVTPMRQPRSISAAQVLAQIGGGGAGAGMGLHGSGYTMHEEVAMATRASIASHDTDARSKTLGQTRGAASEASIDVLRADAPPGFEPPGFVDTGAGAGAGAAAIDTSNTPTELYDGVKVFDVNGTKVPYHLSVMMQQKFYVASRARADRQLPVNVGGGQINQTEINKAYTAVKGSFPREWTAARQAEVVAAHVTPQKPRRSVGVQPGGNVAESARAHVAATEALRSHKIRELEKTLTNPKPK